MIPAMYIVTPRAHQARDPITQVRRGRQRAAQAMERAAAHHVLWATNVPHAVIQQIAERIAGDGSLPRGEYEVKQMPAGTMTFGVRALYFVVDDGLQVQVIGRDDGDRAA